MTFTCLLKWILISDIKRYLNICELVTGRLCLCLFTLNKRYLRGRKQRFVKYWIITETLNRQRDFALFIYQITFIHSRLRTDRTNHTHIISLLSLVFHVMTTNGMGLNLSVLPVCSQRKWLHLYHFFVCVRHSTSISSDNCYKTKWNEIIRNICSFHCWR